MKRLYYFSIWLLLVSSLFVSCETTSDPNSGIIPTTDSLQLRFTDTTTLVAIIEKDDTLRTDGTDRVLLGSYYDPIFGKTTSSFYSTFSIAQTFWNTGGVIVDSVILTMKYDGGYGDLSKFTGYQVLQVFEVIEDISTAPTGGYNSLTSFNYNPIPIATYGYAPQFFPFGSEPAAIRIPINPAFANRFLTGDTINSTKIKNYIKGIYVRIDPTVTAMQSSGQGGIAYFILDSDVSHINIHYHISAATPLTIKLPMGTSSNTRINIFNHDYGAPPTFSTTCDPSFIAKLNDTTNTTASDKLYIQAMEGTRIKVKMPYLKNYLDSGKIIVNRAELVIPIDIAQDIILYPIPGNILTYTLDPDGKVVYMDDTPYTYYDGYYNSTYQEYKIVFTQYLQQVLNDENVASEFYIDIPVFSKNTDAYRLIIHSAEHTTKPLRLKLTYTRIPSL